MAGREEWRGVVNRGWYSHLMLQIKRQVCTLLLMVLIDCTEHSLSYCQDSL